MKPRYEPLRSNLHGCDSNKSEEESEVSDTRRNNEKLRIALNALLNNDSASGAAMHGEAHTSQ